MSIEYLNEVVVFGLSVVFFLWGIWCISPLFKGNPQDENIFFFGFLLIAFFSNLGFCNALTMYLLPEMNEFISLTLALILFIAVFCLLMKMMSVFASVQSDKDELYHIQEGSAFLIPIKQGKKRIFPKKGGSYLLLEGMSGNIDLFLTTDTGQDSRICGNYHLLSGNGMTIEKARHISSFSIPEFVTEAIERHYLLAEAKKGFVTEGRIKKRVKEEVYEKTGCKLVLFMDIFQL